MAVKGILFNTEMVLAILDGRKSCTRRIVKPQWEECPNCKYVHNEYIYDNLAENVYCARCGYPTKWKYHTETIDGEATDEEVERIVGVGEMHDE